MTDTRSNAELDAQVIALDEACEARLVSPPGHPMPNARRFLVGNFDDPEQYRLVYQGGQFYAWNGACWPAIEDQILRSRLYKRFEKCIYVDTGLKEPVEKPFAPTLRKVADLMDALRAVTIIGTDIASPSWLKEKPTDPPADELIACENGLIHWPTRELLPHSPRYYVHHSVPFAFDPEAPLPKRWTDFIAELWGDDTESIRAVQEMFGYLLSGDTSQQKMFLLVGPKRGGKGTIARVLTRLLGRQNVAGPTLASLGSNFGLQDLIGKPVAIISDARLGAKSDSALITERLLSISGEDLQNVDRKYLPPWSGQLPTRFLILTNELPRLADSSGALASRFVVLMLQKSFYDQENPGLTNELCAELPGIFNWALEGLERLRARGRFEQPQTSREAIRQIEDLSSPVSAFLRDRCQLGAELTVEIAVLYQAYRAWCEEQGQKAVNTQVFGRDLRAVRPEVFDRQIGPHRIRHYVGIGIDHSRDSRVNEHCSELRDGGKASAASPPQSIRTRESRECDHCGSPDAPDNEVVECHGSDGSRLLHRGCVDLECNH